jgi:hypothetical protein
VSRILLGIGGVLVLLGCVAWLMERAGLHPGRLPGDISVGSGNVRFYFPVVSCILLSVVLTLAMWVMGALRR